MGVESGPMTKIPSEADFKRARMRARERSRGLDTACEQVKQRFQARCPLHNVYILPQRDVTFRAYVFYRRDTDIAECERSGVTQEIQDSVYAEIERVGRGHRDKITIDFEFDSDENVSANFEGDYFLRLR